MSNALSAAALFNIKQEVRPILVRGLWQD